MRAPNSVHSQQAPSNVNCKFLTDAPPALSVNHNSYKTPYKGANYNPSIIVHFVGKGGKQKGNLYRSTITITAS
jgi:hypothetical protein